MDFSHSSVNVGSRSIAIYGLLFAGLTIFSASTAQADRVVVLQLLGDEGASEELLDDVEEEIATAIQAAGHEFVTEPAAMNVDREELPTTAAEMLAIAELQSSQWVWVGRVSNAPGGYRLALRIFSVAWDREEAVDALIPAEGSSERLREIVGVAISREGLGPHEGWIQSGEPSPEERLAAEEEARRVEAERRAEEERQAEEARAAAAAEEAARAEAEAEEAARQEAWDGRERYGDHGSMLGSGGLGGHLLVAVPESARGGGLVSLQGRFGYDIESVSGLELRAGLDIFLGSASGFALTGGAAYLASPFQDTPIFVGGAVELGYYQALSGNRVPSLLVRASALGTWRMSDDLYLEVALPELTALSANGGALSIGTSVRVGTRF